MTTGYSKVGQCMVKECMDLYIDLMYIAFREGPIVTGTLLQRQSFYTKQKTNKAC